ncbi:DUF2505 domain-containing protein [Actinomyces sp. F1_1611]
MQFSEKYEYPAGFDQIWEMYADPEFHAQRLSAAQLEEATVNAHLDGDDLTVELRGQVSPEAIPAQVSRFVKGRLSLSLMETWHRTGSEATGRMTVDISGAPVKIGAELALTSPAAALTERAMTGDLKVSIPLLGPRLEKEAMRFIPMLVNAELSAAEAWLSSH